MEALIPELSQKYGPMLLVLVALVVTDLLAGIASALKRGAFKWSAIGNVYRTNIMPNVIGWVAVTVLVEMVARVPGAEAFAGPIIAQGISYGGYGLAVFTLGNSIFNNLREASGQAPVTPTIPPAA